MASKADEMTGYLLLPRLLIGGTLRPVRVILFWKSEPSSFLWLPFEADVARTMDIDGDGDPAAAPKVSGGEGEVCIM